MIEKLNTIRSEIEQLTKELICNKELPPKEKAIETVVAYNNLRAAVIALDITLRARHNERHPIKYASHKITSSNDVLTPDVRADIDATP